MSGSRWIRILAFGALATALAAVSAAPVAAQASSPCASCAKEQRNDARRELEEAMQEFRVALTAYEHAVEALARDSSRAAHERLSKTNRELRAISRRLDLAAARLTRLESEAAQTRAQARVPTRVQPARPVHVARARTGYMGVNLSGGAITKPGRDGQMYWEFAEYPKVESVEPGSPAERAGLVAGDLLVALDNRDLTDSVLAFTKLLVPGRRLNVRVRREGELKSFTLVVDELPVRRIVLGRTPRAEVDADPDPFVEVIPAPTPPRTPRTAPTPSAAPMAPMVFEWHLSESLPLAGANLVAVKGELREVFGVERGALIIQVAAGTPASRAGLKGGDVIITAAGSRVSTPHDVQMALERASERRSMVVEIVRKKEKRSVTIRW